LALGSALTQQAAAARLHFTGDRVTDLQILRIKAQEYRLLVDKCTILKRQIAQELKRMTNNLLVLAGLGINWRRLPSADAFASYTDTAPIPASSAEIKGRPAHRRLSR
jgi:hypothetical protein